MRTLKKSFTFTGIAPYLAKKVSMIVRPDERIYFVVNGVEVSVDPKHIKFNNGRHTTLVANKKAKVGSTEHLLSALWGMGIDGARIELTDEEVPMNSGNAKTFVDLINKVGMTGNTNPATFKVKETIVFSDKEGSLALIRPLEKGKTASLSALIQFPGIIDEQYWKTELTPERYEKDICWARTFFRQETTEEMWQKNKARIPGLPDKVEDSPVLAWRDDGWITPPVMHTEPVRHKILDAIGDLACLGKRIAGEITLIRPGHEFNRKLVEYLNETIT